MNPISLALLGVSVGLLLGSLGVYFGATWIEDRRHRKFLEKARLDMEAAIRATELVADHLRAHRGYYARPSSHETHLNEHRELAGLRWSEPVDDD